MATITRRGNRWQVRVRRKGYPEQISSFINKTDAERWGRQIESDIDKGSFQPRAELEKTTLRQILERYRNEVSPLHRGSAVEILRLRKLEAAAIASYSLAALTSGAFAAYRDWRVEYVTSGTVLRELQILSAVLNHARREWNLPIQNLVSGIRRPKPSMARSRRLDGGEYARLLNALEVEERSSNGCFKAMRNFWIKPLVEFAIETAMRRGEILSLHWEHIDLQRQTAFLPLTKNGTSRVVPLSTKAIALLQSLPKSIDGRVFPLTANALKLAYTRSIARAGIADFRFHDLRHEATSRLFELGLNVMEVAAITGHKTLSMLQRYTHLKAEDLAKKLG